MRILIRTISEMTKSIIGLLEKNAELKAENETLKSQLDFEVQKKEVLEAENERLKEEIKKLEDFIKSDGEIDHINHEYTYKLRTCLQEIKNVIEKECKDCLNKRTDSCWICPYYPISNLITKAESDIKNDVKEPKTYNGYLKDEMQNKYYKGK